MKQDMLQPHAQVQLYIAKSCDSSKLNILSIVAGSDIVLNVLRLMLQSHFALALNSYLIKSMQFTQIT